jgi:hypothetical protein
MVVLPDVLETVPVRAAADVKWKALVSSSSVSQARDSVVFAATL